MRFPIGSLLRAWSVLTLLIVLPPPPAPAHDSNTGDIVHLLIMQDTAYVTFQMDARDALVFYTGADENHDGKLSMPEFEKNHGVFGEKLAKSVSFANDGTTLSAVETKLEPALQGADGLVEELKLTATYRNGDKTSFGNVIVDPNIFRPRNPRAGVSAKGTDRPATLKVYDRGKNLEAKTTGTLVYDSAKGIVTF